MNSVLQLINFTDKMLVFPFFLTLIFSIIISFKLRFIQIRAIKKMFKMLVLNKVEDSVEGVEQSVSPRSALLIALSTSIGISNIAGPIVVMGMGGPGAMAGFLLASFFGAAMTFWEVFLAVKYRRTLKNGSFAGGPMEYLNKYFNKSFALFYSAATFLAITLWTSNQSNNLALLLESSGIAKPITGIVLTILVLAVLIGGVKRIGKVNDIMVPFMFVIYCVLTLSIIFHHYDQIPNALRLIFVSPFSLQGAGGFAGGFGMIAIIRSGFARAVQTNEFGIGTATFPHSATTGANPYYQAILSMAAVYANTFLSMLTALTVLVTGAWKTQGAAFDVSMFYKIVVAHFPTLGGTMLTVCGVLFAFGTILGNSYNANQCFNFGFKNNYKILFYFFVALSIIFGSVATGNTTWILADYFIVPVVIPHTIAILILALRENNIFKKDT